MCVSSAAIAVRVVYDQGRHWPWRVGTATIPALTTCHAGSSFCHALRHSSLRTQFLETQESNLHSARTSLACSPFPRLRAVQSLYEQIYKLMVARDADQSEQEMQQQQQREAADGEGEGEGEGDADGGEAGTGAPSPSGSSPGPRFSALVAPSGVSNASSALVALMGPFRAGSGGGGGGGEDSKRARRLQGGGGDAADGADSAGGGAGGQAVHHSFASFVSRRSQAGKSDAVTSATIGSAIGGGGMGGGAGGGGGGELVPTGRTQSVTSSVHAVVERVHSTLVASGRIESVTALAGGGAHRLSRFAGGGGGGGGGGAGGGGGTSRRTIALGSVGSVSRRTASASPIIPGGLNGLIAGGTADPDGATVGPGLPVIDANGLGGGQGDEDEEQAVSGSARLRALAPGQGQGKRGSGDGVGGKQGKRGSSGAGEGEAERERTSNGPAVDELRKLQGSASRRTGAGQSQQTMRGQLSTKAMLQQVGPAWRVWGMVFAAAHQGAFGGPRAARS